MKTRSYTGWLQTLVCCATLMVSAVALAHHSMAMWDKESTKEIQGSIKAFEWTNPHVWIWVTADEPQAQTWAIEAGAINSMRRHGWSRDSLIAGEKVTVTVHPHRKGAQLNGNELGALVSVKRADGTPVPAPKE